MKFLVGFFNIHSFYQHGFDNRHLMVSFFNDLSITGNTRSTGEFVPDIRRRIYSIKILKFVRFSLLAWKC